MIYESFYLKARKAPYETEHDLKYDLAEDWPSSSLPDLLFLLMRCLLLFEEIMGRTLYSISALTKRSRT